jgi:hypothetical protein
MYPHACGLIGQFGRCAAPRGGAIRALGRPGGAHRVAGMVKVNVEPLPGSLVPESARARSLHLTITIAGGCHVPFPAGKIDGGVAFGQ